MAAPVTVPCSDLRPPKGFYVRKVLDRTRIGHLKRALDAGEVLPPVLVSQHARPGLDRLIVDGRMRWVAVRERGGDDAPIAVEIRRYRSKSAIYGDMMLLNTAHGKNLSPADIAHCIETARRMGMPLALVASSLRISLGEVRKQLRIRVRRIGSGYATLPRPLVPIFPDGGRRFTKRDAEAAAHIPAQSASALAGALGKYLNLNWFRPGDAATPQRLAALFGDLWAWARDTYGAPEGIDAGASAAAAWFAEQAGA